MSQNYTDEELKNMIPVFNLKPTSSTRVKCVLKGFSDKEERIFDDQLEVETTDAIKEKVGNNTLLLNIVNKHIIVGKYCLCNIPGGYLINNQKLPIYYLSILYTKPLITGCLFNIFVYFEMDDESKNRLDNPQKYYKAFIDGKYTTQCVPTDDDFLIKLKPLVERDVMIEYKDKFDNIKNDDEQDNIMEEIINKIQNKMAIYEGYFNSREYDDKIPTQKSAFNNLKNICDDPIMDELIIYGLTIRENDRIAERGDIDMKYEIPKNIINLREIKKDPSKLDEIMASREKEDDE
jgi:hypothetical protein